MSLKQGTLNWFMVAGIGVSIVIAGQFSGWNFGLEYGWSNMFIAFVLMFLFYLGLTQCLSEMASTWPSAGGQSSFVRRAFGDFPGSCIGITIGITLIACTGLIASFIVGYAASLIDANETIVKLALFIAVVLLSLRGAKDLLSVTLIVGVIAVLTLLVFSLGVAPEFKFEHLQITQSPISLAGIIGAAPFALWLFVGIEHTVTCSEEMKNLRKDLPLGMSIGVWLLAITGIAILFAAPGAVGTHHLVHALDPLSIAILAENVWLKKIVVVGVLIGLLAGFFSVVYSASRQLFDVSREGVVPAVFSKIDKNGTPFYAILCVAVVGFCLSLLDPVQVMLGVVTVVTFTYILTSASFIRLRQTRQHVERGYNAVGGIYLGYVMLISSVILFATSFKFDVVVLGPVVTIMICMTYKYFHNRQVVRKAIKF